MRWLAYASEAVEFFDQNALEELEQAAHRKNIEHDVTGVLMYLCPFQNMGFFVQYLEGSEDALEIIMERIRADERHHEIDVFDTGDLKKRLFPAWSMKAVDPNIRMPLKRSVSDLLAETCSGRRRQVFEYPIIGQLSEVYDAATDAALPSEVACGNQASLGKS